MGRAINFHKETNKRTETLSLLQALGKGHALVRSEKMPKQNEHAEQRWRLVFADGSEKVVAEAALLNRAQLEATRK